ncbi:unnamed protein product [Pleuronectes platessa]|uniref:Uncharacterized protein n=1 Tax=Pleuronectes platessa TaxID=8262 RepID=A0A9N7THS6_PLEPL|nr:unnamed protein product [Pleuronectes platessa]
MLRPSVTSGGFPKEEVRRKTEPQTKRMAQSYASMSFSQETFHHHAGQCVGCEGASQTAATGSSVSCDQR